MRNSNYLDNPRPEDNNIGELQQDKIGDYRIINGKKVYQLECKTPEDYDKQLTINRYRASGLSLIEYVKSVYQN